jgi:three-Cys-motif partner protein
VSKQMNNEIITEAKPHTIKKFELIERYVDEWARKILGYDGKDGREGSKGIIYIDCMSNSGVYRDENGNQIEGTALRVAKRLNDIVTNYPGKSAILIFNDISEQRIEYLKTVIEKANLTNIQVVYRSEDCNSFLRGLDLDSYKRQFNTLLLYDPYKAAIDWDAVTPFLNTWGEVIINHMVFDTSRGASQAKKKNVIVRYTETYQEDIGTIIKMGKDKHQLNDAIIAIINKRRTGSPQRKYIASFPFFTRTNGLVYNLIHCCSNIEGIKLFKRVAWKTFGDKSSLKNTHGDEMQLQFNLTGEGFFDSPTDEDCYFVKDIAKYIYDKYKSNNPLYLTTIYADLDEHPIFPSDGYKNEIKDELRRTYGAKFHRNGTVTFADTEGV